MLRSALIGFVVMLALAAGPALSDERADSIVRQLRDQGYNNIRISRTFLGRTRIVATVGDAQREIIVNPRTGEILRDYSKSGGDTGRILQSADTKTGKDNYGNDASAAGSSDDGNGDGGDGDGGDDGGGDGGDGGDGDGGDGGGGDGGDGGDGGGGDGGDGGGGDGGDGGGGDD